MKQKGSRSSLMPCVACFGILYCFFETLETGIDGFTQLFYLKFDMGGASVFFADFLHVLHSNVDTMLPNRIVKEELWTTKKPHYE